MSGHDDLLLRGAVVLQGQDQRVGSGLQEGTGRTGWGGSGVAGVQHSTV